MIIRRFMIGQTSSPSLSAAVEVEAARHGDICRLQLLETYGGLREKVGAILVWWSIITSILTLSINGE